MLQRRASISKCRRESADKFFGEMEKVTERFASFTGISDNTSTDTRTAVANFTRPG